VNIMNRRAFFLIYRGLLCVSLSFAAPHLISQVSNQLNTGYPENGVFRGTDIETVQMNNGGLHVDIPIFSAKARGFNVSSKVIYNSKSWTFRTRCFTSGGGFCEDDVGSDSLGYPGLVFAGAFDYMFHASGRTCQQTQNVFLSIAGGYTLREPDGTKHHFAPDPLVESACVPPHYSATVYADDGSGWIMRINTSDGSMISAISKTGLVVLASCDGCATNISASLFVDANGNQMQPASTCCGTSGLGGTDTLGRTIPANGGYYDSSGTLQTPTLSGSVTVALNTDGLCSFATADTCVPNDGSRILPTQLQLPNGDVFTFTYAQNGGGELASMTLPTGGQVSWTWGGWGQGGRNIASRTVTADGVTGIWNYNMGIDGGGVVTDPAHKDTRYTCGSGTCSKIEYFDGPVGASPLIKTVTTDYQQVVSLNSDASTDPVGLLPIRQTTTWNQQNLTMKTETDWDTQFISGAGTVSWHNPIEKRVFDWGSDPAQLTLLQRIHSSFKHLEANGQAYLAANIADLPTLVQTYDGAGAMLAQTQNSYDGSSVTSTGTCQAPSVVNHDYCNYGSGNLLRGNLTQVSRWVNTSSTWANTNNTYDDLGNMLSTSDPLNHTTTFDYTDNWGGTGCVTAGSTRAFPTTVTNAKSQRVKTSYFPCTSMVQSKRDENDIVAGRPGTTYTYDLMNRPLSIQTLDVGNQILAKTSWTYNDTVLPLSITKTVTASPSPDIVSTSVMDDLGRTSQTIRNDPEGNVTSEATYDSFGRVDTVTNPHRAVAAATDGVTRYVYDTLGRTTDLVKPDNGKVHTDYAGNAVTVTDETLRQRRTVTDGLGRLIEVDEPGGTKSAGIQATASVTISGAFNSTWVAAGTPHLAATGSALASVTMSDGSSHDFYFDTNQHLCQMSWFSGSGWFDQDLTSMTEAALPLAGSSIAAVALGSVIHVFYQGANQHIYDMNWTGSIWQNLDMTVLTGASPVSNTKMAIVDTGSSNTPMMFYEGTNQHLFCIYWYAPTTAWANADLHSLSGATNLIAPNGSISAGMWGTTGNIHALFLDTNQNLNRIVWSGTAWITNNLTSMTGAALAVAGSKLTTIATGTPIDLMTFYEGAGQHIYSIYWNGSAGTYQTLDFTSWSGATNIAAVLTSLANNPAGPHMFYFSSNQHLDDILWNGSAWVNADLTSLANTTALPASGSSLSSHGTSGGNTYNIFFEGGNQHIYHTYYSPSASAWFNEDPLVTASNFIVDSGTVSLSIPTGTSTFTATVCYGISANSFCAGKPINASSTGIANALAAVLNGAGSPVNATVTGTTLNLTWRAIGAITLTVAPMASTSDYPSLFLTGSFTSTSANFGGGANPGDQSLTNSLVTFYRYDALGNLTCVEQHGDAPTGTGCSASPASDATSPWRLRRFSYDSLSRLLTAKNPEAGQTTYQYDNDSNLISKTDARGVTINYSPSGSPIDVLHRVTQKTYSDGTPAVTYQYDTGCCGVTPANPAGRMTAAFSGNTELVFSYDAMGRITTQWDCPPSGIARGFCYVISAQYDDTGNITSLTYPDNRVVTTGYNSAGRFVRTDLASFGGTAVNFNYYTVPQSLSAANWGYFPTGAMNRGTYGNGVIETTGYNNRLQVSSIADSISGTAFFSKAYGFADVAFHNNGNIVTITDTLNAAKTQTFTYDSLNRIVTGAQTDNAFNLSYSYDAWGNMKESGTSNFQPLFDVNNRMIPSGGCSPNLVPYCYDAAGDLLMDNHNHVYAYDGEARIKTVDGTAATYTYNPLGNRVRKDAGSTSTEYFFFGGAVIAELNPSTSAWTDYIGYGKRIAKDTSSNGTGSQYYHADHLGSARVMTDSAGVVISNCTYNPFGEEVGCSPNNASNHYRFTGKERDSESGLDDFGARYFSSSMGRWATPDWSARPATVPYADFGDPQSLNLYLYVRNDPVSQADADGHVSNDSGGESCLSSFACTVQYLEHVKDNQPSGWFSVTSSFSSGSDDGSGEGADQGQQQQNDQQQNGTVPVTVGQRPIQNKVAQFFSVLFTFHKAYHSYYRLTGDDGVTHQFEVLGDPGGPHNQQVRDTYGTSRQSVGTEHTVYATEAQAQKLIDGSEHFLSNPCPTCTGGQEGYNLVFHNSNSFVYNMLNSDGIRPPAAPSITPGYARKPDDIWYPQ
jgi:RHS repeat-associated protein